MDSPSAFELIAELSLATIGFAGVAAAFGGSERAYKHVERIRIGGVLAQAGTALGGSLLFQILLMAELSLRNSVRATAICLLILTVFRMISNLPGIYRAAGNSESSTPMGVAYLMTASFTLPLLCFGAALVLDKNAWALLAGFSIQLGSAVALFARLLTRVE